MKGIFYRSDTRTPNAPDNMFTRGFDKRDATQPQPKLRLPAGTAMAPDVVSSSAVCITRHFEAAPLFPVADLNTDTWVYVFDLDTTNITNTQKMQWDYVQTNLLGSDPNALWPMFGQERAVNSIVIGDIVGAVKVSRNFGGRTNVFNGGTFLCREYVANASYTGPASTAALAADLIVRLVGGAGIAMPTQAQGIVQSTRT